MAARDWTRQKRSRNFSPRGSMAFACDCRADDWYALAMPGLVYRSRNGLTDLVLGPTLFNPDMRHNALLKRGDTLYVFWTQADDTPERILVSSVPRCIKQSIPRELASPRPGT